MRTSAILVFLLLSSCTRVVEADFVEPARRIQVGVSDRRAVDEMLGPPVYSSFKGSEEMWVYARKGESSLASSLGKIPLVGEALFVEPFPTSGNPTVRQVTIVFQNNIVTSCKIVMSSPDAAGRTTVYGCSELQ
jgi:hypothetical protein